MTKIIPRSPILTIQIKKEMGQVLEHLLNKLGLSKSCLSCYYFLEKEELCSHVMQRPPARIIVEGCELYFDNNKNETA